MEDAAAKADDGMETFTDADDDDYCRAMSDQQIDFLSAGLARM